MIEHIVPKREPLAKIVEETEMLAEQPEFDGRTSVGFLLAGGEPELVAGLLESLALW